VSRLTDMELTALAGRFPIRNAVDALEAVEAKEPK
jgi:hypothetical protein